MQAWLSFYQACICTSGTISPPLCKLRHWQLGRAVIGAASSADWPLTASHARNSGAKAQRCSFWGLQMAGPMVQYLVMPGPLNQHNQIGVGRTALVCGMVYSAVF